MKIALFTSEFPPFSGGIATYAHELASAAAKEGHEVTVAAPDYGADQSELDATLPYRVIRFAGGVSTARGLPDRIRLARRLLRRERFDIIHAADWPFFIPVRLAPRGSADVILTVHGTEIGYMQAPKRRLLLGMIGFWRRGWARWVGNSAYTTGLLLRAFPSVSADDAQGLALGVSENWFSRRVPRAEARAALGLGPADRVIVSLGRIVPRKGHEDVADALALLPDELAPHVQWWVIGPPVDAAHADRLRIRAAALPVHATLFGGLPAEDVALRLSAADLFCLPGYTDETGRVEGFGLVFLEAAAFGVPSVATRSGGIAEAVLDGKTGLLVGERDVAALADALGRLLADDALHAELAANAEAHATASTWGAVMRATYRIG